MLVELPAGPPFRAKDGESNEDDNRKAEAVLVVDDEREIRDILREALEVEGLPVHTAEDGEQGLKMLHSRPYRLVILDLRMPGLSGLELLSEINRMHRRPPVMILTGMASPEEIETALGYGAERCLRKPFQIDSLVAEVRDLLQAAEQHGG